MYLKILTLISYVRTLFGRTKAEMSVFPYAFALNGSTHDLFNCVPSEKKCSQTYMDERVYSVFEKNIKLWLFLK